MMTDRTLEPNEVTEGMAVAFDWSPEKSSGGGTVEGKITRVWQPDDDVQEFTVEADDGTVWNVYTEYRRPPVERVELSGDRNGTEPDARTVGRLDEIVRA
ncbi:hypothetical protein [Haladaptatus sp. T7]|uniref:hypothetical protein n=1 Tax=Haladaptatus sp. T7 TaxID=2029368 RepID=UPI00222F548B|nr:hypothetical protein [Haladaptatus sp. T7]